ncbi:MAG: hypothetical protein K2X81_04715, partial [Candidatus Obscuribacterales bacterium]|nr:hypothetical protein [Candidatus Obscuribacterales bacterium]
MRCFLRQITDQAYRYEKLQEAINKESMPFSVDFFYIPEGIKIRGEWFPVVKMEWVEGVTLDQFIRTNWHQSELMGKLADEFARIVGKLSVASVAHGDLQHANIMLLDAELKLVDYDDFYVPTMHGIKSSELGHRNYQHPGRTADDFGLLIDNFSAWVIYASLRTLSLDPDLSVRLSNWDDCMLFKYSDFKNPTESTTFQFLLKHVNPEIRNLAWRIYRNLRETLHEIPPLGAPALPGDEICPASEPIQLEIPGSKPTPIEIPASDLIETRHLKIQAEFALPSLTLVYSPEYLKKEKSAVARRLWPSIDDLDRAHAYNPVDIERVLSFLRKSKPYHKAAIDGCLDLFGFAETISPIVEKLPGEPLPVESIAQILANFVTLAKQEEHAIEIAKVDSQNELAAASEATPKFELASKQIANIMAAQSHYAFSSRYLSEQCSFETQFTLFELVVALGVILLFVSSGFMGTDISYMIVFLAVVYGGWK